MCDFTIRADPASPGYAGGRNRSATQREIPDRVATMGIPDADDPLATTPTPNSDIAAAVDGIRRLVFESRGGKIGEQSLCDPTAVNS